MNLTDILTGIGKDVILAVDTPPFKTVHAGWDELSELIHDWPENEHDISKSVTLAREIAATAIRYVLDMTARIAAEGEAGAEQATL